MTTLFKKRRVLKNGLKVRFRPIRATDTPHLLNIFEHLSPDSRYSRFQVSAEGMPTALIETRAAQTALDSVTHGYGLLAFADLDQQVNAPLGGARYYTDLSDPYSAELAITIRDDMQGLGLGKALLKKLIKEARRRGITYFTGVALAGNHGIWGLLASTDLPLDRWYDGPDMHFSLKL